MNWFKNAKISTKLMGSFAVVAIIAGVIGWTGLSGARSLAAVADEVYKNQLVSIAELETANSEFLMARLALREAFLYTGAERQQRERTSAEHMRLMEQHIAKYKTTGLSDDEKKLVPQLDASVPEYNRARELAFSQLSRGDEKAALQVMSGEGKLSGDALTSVLDKLTEINSRLAADNNKQAEANAASVERQITIFIAVGVVMALGLGFVISRMIATPLRALASASDRMALGDMNVELPAENKDEIGMLATSFRAMSENVRARSEAAQKIAAGDMSVQVTPKSERDVLGHAL